MPRASARVPTLPTLASTDAAADRAYAAAAEWVATRLSRDDVAVAAALGRFLALAAPGHAAKWARSAVDLGDGAAAVRLLDAHLAEGGHEGVLADPVGGQRLLEAAEEAALPNWGADLRADRDTAALLGGLYWRLDPTDSYLFASRWDARAEALAAPAEAGAPAVPGGGRPAAVGEVLHVWQRWFGLGCDATGWHVKVPRPPDPGTPPQRRLSGVRRPGGGRAEVRVVDGERVELRTSLGTVEGGIGRRLPLR